MKKIFTTLVFGLAFVGLFAQYGDITGQTIANDARIAEQKPDFNSLQIKNGSRAITESYVMSYPAYDDEYANNVTFGTTTGFVWRNNANWPCSPNARNTTFTYAGVQFDSIINMNGNWPFVPYPVAAIDSMWIDSLYLRFSHENTTGNTDSIVITVRDGDNSGAIIYQKSITTDTTLSPGIQSNGIPEGYWEVVQPASRVYVPSTTFYVQADFYGDTANQFWILALERDDCGGNCIAERSSIPGNSEFFLNFFTTNGTNLCGNNYLASDCNSDGIGGTPGECELFGPQNWYILPFVTSVVDFGVSISANDGLEACDGDILSFTANDFGAAGGATYAWTATTGGTVSNPTAQTTDVIVSGSNDVTVTCTVTEIGGSMATASEQVVISNASVNVSIVGNTNISCGQTTTLAAQLSGNSSGATYNWNTGSTASALSGLGVGSYAVTVTNQTGCTATDNVDVQIPGLNQSIAFNANPDPGCEDQEVTFTNNSTRTSGWSWEWSANGSPFSSATTGATNTWPNPGTVTIELKGDSASCSLTASKGLTILAASNPACLTSIKEVDFADLIEIYPNPSNGIFEINIEGLTNDAMISVYNLQGKEVFVQDISNVASYKSTINLENEANGTYLVKIQSGSKFATSMITLSK